MTPTPKAVCNTRRFRNVSTKKSGIPILHDIQQMLEPWKQYVTLWGHQVVFKKQLWDSDPPII